MQSKDLATILIRILAIYISLQGLLFIAEFLSAWSKAEKSEEDIFSIIFMIALGPLFIAMIVWMLAPKLASFTVRGLSPGLEITQLDAEALTSCAFVIAGVVILVLNFPDLISSIIHIAFRPESIGIEWLFAAALKCLLSIGLIIRARNIARSLSRLRYAATNKNL